MQVFQVIISEIKLNYDYYINMNFFNSEILKRLFGTFGCQSQQEYALDDNFERRKEKFYENYPQNLCDDN